MTMKLDNAEEKFTSSWANKWEDAIVSYATAPDHKTVGLKYALREWNPKKEDDGKTFTLSRDCTIAINIA